jgi:hypothetical protein
VPLQSSRVRWKQRSNIRRHDKTNATSTETVAGEGKSCDGKETSEKGKGKGAAAQDAERRVWDSGRGFVFAMPPLVCPLAARFTYLPLLIAGALLADTPGRDDPCSLTE